MCIIINISGVGRAEQHFIKLSIKAVQGTTPVKVIKFRVKDQAFIFRII